MLALACSPAEDIEGVGLRQGAVLLGERVRLQVASGYAASARREPGINMLTRGLVVSGEQHKEAIDA